METKINKTLKTLKVQFFLFWLIPILLFVAYETNLLGVGTYADDPQMQYVWETIGILVAIACVPLALKLFSIVLKKKIDEVSFPAALSKYQLWSGIRLGILEFAALLNIVVYYFTLNNIGGLCALIAMTASLFCFPGEKRMREELNIITDDESNIPGK